MMSVSPFIMALAVILAVGVLAWLFSVVRKDVSIVDSLWSLFSLVAAWALRLSIFITARRPAYAGYVRNTNAFFPGRRKQA